MTYKVTLNIAFIDAVAKCRYAFLHSIHQRMTKCVACRAISHERRGIRWLIVSDFRFPTRVCPGEPRGRKKRRNRRNWWKPCVRYSRRCKKNPERRLLTSKKVKKNGGFDGNQVCWRRIGRQKPMDCLRNRWLTCIGSWRRKSWID